MRGEIIAIDGPVASGKGTIAPLLAETLRAFYLPTGAMYRCVVLFCQRLNILSDPNKIIKVLPRIGITITDTDIFLNGENVTEAIKQNSISKQTSLVAGISEVRKYLIGIMRKLAEEYREKGITVVAEGRDIGTVVFPDAELKIYLTASPAVRARRRLEQLQKQGDTSAEYTKVFAETVARDTYDQQESKALVTDPEKAGYIVLDSSDLTEEETLMRLERIVKQKGIVHD